MTERPLTETLYCISMRCTSSRCVRGGRIEETLATENEGEMSYAHLRMYTQPTQLFSAGASLQSTPSPLCELAWWPLLGALHYVFGG